MFNKNGKYVCHYKRSEFYFTRTILKKTKQQIAIFVLFFHGDVHCYNAKRVLLV